MDASLLVLHPSIRLVKGNMMKYASCECSSYNILNENTVPVYIKMKRPPKQEEEKKEKLKNIADRYRILYCSV